MRSILCLIVFLAAPCVCAAQPTKADADDAWVSARVVFKTAKVKYQAEVDRYRKLMGLPRLQESGLMSVAELNEHRALTRSQHTMLGYVREHAVESATSLLTASDLLDELYVAYDVEDWDGVLFYYGAVALFAAAADAETNRMLLWNDSLWAGRLKLEGLQKLKIVVNND